MISGEWRCRAAVVHGTLVIATSPKLMNLLQPSSPRRPLGILRRLPMFLLRVVLGLVGLVFTLALVAFGLVAGSALVAWALLRGRRPQGLRFDVRRGGMFDGPGFRRATSRGEVVDVEAREVSDRPLRP
jgi:hypothetical protein